MDAGGGVQTDSEVRVFAIIVVEESVAEGAGVGQGTESVGERGTVFEGLELRLAVRVVVGDVWSGMALRDVEVGEERGDRFRRHRGAAVGVHRPRAHAAIVDDGVLDERFGEGRVFGGVYFPAHGFS